jgi:hypothetical protein
LCPPTSTIYDACNKNHQFEELDQLTLLELEFVCGTYCIYTNKGMQIAKQSWWPPHHIWKGNGHDMGYWSQAAEDWFHKCLVSIRDNPGMELKMPTKWDNYLKYQIKEMRPFLKNSSVAAADFLTGRPFM